MNPIWLQGFFLQDLPQLDTQLTPTHTAWRGGGQVARLGQVKGRAQGDTGQGMFSQHIPPALQHFKTLPWPDLGNKHQGKARHGEPSECAVL